MPCDWPGMAMDRIIEIFVFGEKKRDRSLVRGFEIYRLVRDKTAQSDKKKVWRVVRERKKEMDVDKLC